MQNIVAKIGGTPLERALVEVLSACARNSTRGPQIPGPSWVNERIHPGAHLEQLKLRKRLLEFGSAFAVPVSYWQVAPIGVRSSDLGKFLEWVTQQPDLQLLTPVQAPNDAPEFIEGDLNSRAYFTDVKKGRKTVFVSDRSSQSQVMVPVEVWKKTSKTNFSSPGWNGSISEIGPAESNSGLLDLDGEMARHSFHDISFGIDAVYLWVDGSDPKWIERKLAFTGANATHGTSESRFISRNELYFSIATLVKNAPWINRIWLVTDDQTPDLGEFADRVAIVNHTDFIPAEYLPTFNSHVITSHLHRIEGLSEQFLYLNDDILIGRPLLPSAWFDSHGRSLIRYTRTTLPGFSVDAPDVIHQARQKTVRVAIEAGLQISMRSIQHGPHPLRKSVMQKMWTDFESEMVATSLNRFRTEADVVPEWLHNFIAYTGGQAVLGGKLTYAYIVLNAKSSLNKILKLVLKRPPSVVCLNDVSEIAESDRASEKVTEYRLKKIASLLLRD
jgi:hypothetical protein